MGGVTLWGGGLEVRGVLVFAGGMREEGRVRHGGGGRQIVLLVHMWPL